jgi:hypothetical protein
MPRGRHGLRRWVVACWVHAVCAQSVVPLENMQMVQLSIPNCTGLLAEAVRSQTWHPSFPIQAVGFTRPSRLAAGRLQEDCTLT